MGLLQMDFLKNAEDTLYHPDYVYVTHAGTFEHTNNLR